jgi:hypothetical protein
MILMRLPPAQLFDFPVQQLRPDEGLIWINRGDGAIT